MKNKDKRKIRRWSARWPALLGLTPRHARQAAVLSTLLLGAGGVLSAPQKAPIHYEVVSIKPNRSNVFRYGGNCSGADKLATMLGVPLGHCRLENIPVEYLIHMAYSAEVPAGYLEPTIVGLPAWCNSERFDIDAKAENAALTQSQLYEMLRSVLTDRFHLQFHRTTEEAPGYKLVVAKGGHKLSAPQPGERYGYGAQIAQINGRNAALSDLQYTLARRFQAPVSDETGLTGKYDFRLTFDPGSTGYVFEGRGVVNDPTSPDIFTALQEQLGLKLEKTRLPVVRYVIESIQRPAAN